jgi:hypothetical protein
VWTVLDFLVDSPAFCYISDGESDSNSLKKEGGAPAPAAAPEPTTSEKLLTETQDYCRNSGRCGRQPTNMKVNM